MTAPGDWNRIYVAGPMTGYPEFNYPAFIAAEARLREVGFDVVNPATMGDGGTGQPWEFYMRRGITGLLTCNRVALLPEWHLSRGARLEVSIAAELGFPVHPLEVYLR